MNKACKYYRKLKAFFLAIGVKLHYPECSFKSLMKTAESRYSRGNNERN